MFFDSNRSPPFPTTYPENKTPVTVDVLEVGWIVAFVTVFVTFCTIAFGRTKKECIYVFIRVTLSLFIGLVIMLCNFGHEWEVGHVQATTPYRAGIRDHIHAEIGVKLGLRAVNITLRAPDRGQEKIDYNERFWWTWTQGRNGFGPFAGEVQQEFREHQRRGTPYPILWVAEYFTIDGEGIRFGRHYRHAGWYAHICVWTAFPLWILAHVTLLMVPIYGGILLILTGIFLLTAALIWCGNRNFIELAIPFSHERENVFLTTHYGAHWYLALSVGIGCMVLGGLIYLLSSSEKFEGWVLEFFGINQLDFVDIYEEEAPKSVGPSNEMEMEEMNQEHENPNLVLTLRRRGSVAWHRQGPSSMKRGEAWPAERPPSLPPSAKLKLKLGAIRGQKKQLPLLPAGSPSQAQPHHKNLAYVDEEPAYSNLQREPEESLYANIPSRPALPPRKK